MCIKCDDAGLNIKYDVIALNMNGDITVLNNPSLSGPSVCWSVILNLTAKAVRFKITTSTHIY